VPQGGAFGMAATGASVLAGEILSFWAEHGHGKSLSVCVPGGTCSTAVLLHHELKRMQVARKGGTLDVKVVVIPCVGDAAYARRQMMSLSSQIGAPADDIPSILAPEPEEWQMQTRAEKQRYFSFGEPDKLILDTFALMRDEHGAVLDLVYGAPAWTILLRHWEVKLSPDLSFDPLNPIAGREIMYVHSGGLEGINSQLLRYNYKGLVAIEDIQLPGKSGK
jgi:1-aminocyclopropane-1-carboxylate deaminase/D-cysteine desulfhydrase-like pyridoxal-dependent ACC family enzyme